MAGLPPGEKTPSAFSYKVTLKGGALNPIKISKDRDRVFIERDGFKYMIYPKEIVAKVLHLYSEGLSLGRIRDHIWQHEGYYLYDSRILEWVKKYSHLLEDYEGGLIPKIVRRVHMDETVVKVKRSCMGT